MQTQRLANHIVGCEEQIQCVPVNWDNLILRLNNSANIYRNHNAKARSKTLNYLPLNWIYKWMHDP